MKSSANNEIRDYFKILKEDPTSRVFAPLAEALVRRGRLDEAEKICQLGLEANPDFSDGHLAYARVLYYLFRYQEAIEQVKLTLATTPNKVEAYLIAAEIFLARSQHKPASDACLKAIDIDPENIEARQILKRINAQVEEDKQDRAGLKKEAPRRESTSKFRATAGTAPSRRIQDPGEKPSPADPFRQLLQETGKVGTGRLERVEQPFSALSPGSYPADDREFGEADTEDLEEDTAVSERRKEAAVGQQDQPVMGLKKYRRDGTPIPKLPEHPPEPDEPGDILARVPLEQVMAADTRPEFQAPADFVPPQTQAAGPDSSMPSVESVQSLIDAYSLRSQSEMYESAPIKMPRSGRLLVILFALGSVGAIVGLLLLGFNRDRSPPASGDQAKAASAPGGDIPPATEEPIPLPGPEPAPPDETDPPSQPEPDQAVAEPPPSEPEPGPEPAKKAATVPPRKKKTTRRRKRRRRKKRRRKTRKKRKRTRKR